MVGSCFRNGSKFRRILPVPAGRLCHGWVLRPLIMSAIHLFYSYVRCMTLSTNIAALSSAIAYSFHLEQKTISRVMDFFPCAPNLLVYGTFVLHQ